ncbi:putative transcriptional regulators [Candidatus Termititenax aidoneus]|uniref:Transcriptional regulators n=1 Tax=Termititenax aidoneus TaxID=2218524 RepID=A0A388TCR8_TERA1|nr:putative transcriptional regulators [Candidatus Termititenax aidoneus]
MKSSYARISGLRSGFYKIERICHLSGLTPRMLRYYEKTGLLPEPLRTSGGIRLYQDKHLRLLMEITSAKRQGLSLREIRSKFAPERPNQNKTLFLIDSFFSPDPQILQKAGARLLPMNINFGYYKYADYTTLDPLKFAELENKKRLLASVSKPTGAEYREIFRSACKNSKVISLHPDRRIWDTYEPAGVAEKSLQPAPLKIINTNLWGGLNFYLEQLLAEPQKTKAILAEAQKTVFEIIIVKSPERLFSGSPNNKKQPFDLFNFTPVFQHTAQSGLVPIARENNFADACHYVWPEIKKTEKIIAYSSPEILAEAHALGLKAAREIPLSSAVLALLGREILAVFCRKN